MMETIQFDRYHTVLRAAQNVIFSKNTAQKLVVGQRRLDRRLVEGKLRAKKKADRQNARLECNGADVLRYTIDPSLKH